MLCSFSNGEESVLDSPLQTGFPSCVHQTRTASSQILKRIPRAACVSLSQDFRQRDSQCSTWNKLEGKREIWLLSRFGEIWLLSRFLLLFPALVSDGEGIPNFLRGTNWKVSRHFWRDCLSILFRPFVASLPSPLVAAPNSALVSAPNSFALRVSLAPNSFSLAAPNSFRLAFPRDRAFFARDSVLSHEKRVRESAEG